MSSRGPRGPSRTKAVAPYPDPDPDPEPAARTHTAGHLPPRGALQHPSPLTSRGPPSRESAEDAAQPQRTPRATDGWRPLPRAGRRAAGSRPGRGSSGGRRAPPAPGPAPGWSREPALPGLPSPPRRSLGVSQHRPPLPLPLRLRREPGAPIQTDNAPRLSDQPMAGAGAGRRRGLRVGRTGERGEEKGDGERGDEEGGGCGPSRSGTCPPPPRRVAFASSSNTNGGRSDKHRPGSAQSASARPLNDGSPKPVPPAQARPDPRASTRRAPRVQTGALCGNGAVRDRAGQCWRRSRDTGRQLASVTRCHAPNTSGRRTSSHALPLQRKLFF